MLYGGGRILLSVPPPILVMLGVWMVGALLIQHGVVSPLVVAVGAALRRIPDRGRRFLQIGLIAAAMVTAVAIPLILRQGTQPPAKALLLQNYAANLTLLLGLIAGGDPGRVRGAGGPRPPLLTHLAAGTPAPRHVLRLRGRASCRQVVQARAAAPGTR